MAFQNITPIAIYTADGVATAFAIPTGFYDNDDVQVCLVVDGAETWVTTGFTIVETSRGLTPPAIRQGNVVFGVAPSDGVSVVILSWPHSDQDQIFEGRVVTPKERERVHDRHSMRDAVLRQFVRRAWRSPLTSLPPEGGYTIVPGDDGQVAVFDAFGNLVPGPDAGDIAGAQDSAERAESAAERAENAASSIIQAATNFKTIPDLIADTTVGYVGSGADVEVAAGDRVSAQGMLFAVAPTDAVDWHIENANGVKMLEAGWVFTHIDRLARVVGYEGYSARLTQPWRDGIFIWRQDDMSVEVASDPARGLYVAPDSDPTGASGAWVRQFNGPIFVSWFGASPDLADNTAVYNRIIAALPDGTEIVWPKSSGVWKGHFVPPVGRSFIIDGGGNTPSEVTNDPLFYMTGSAEIVTTLTANATYGQRTLTMASTAALSAGDLIMLEDGFNHPSDTPARPINQEILRVFSVDSGTQVTVEDKVRSNQTVGTRNVYKITPVVGAEIRNVKASIENPYNHTTTSGLHSSNPIRIDWSDRAVIKNCSARNSYGEGINVRYAYDAHLIEPVVEDGHDRANGGYGVSIYVGRKFTIDRPRTRNTRNHVDLHACYDYTIFEPDCTDAHYGINIAHNITGGGGTIIRPRIRDLVATGGSRGIADGLQGLAAQAAVDYVRRDITIIDAEITTLATHAAAGNYLVYFQTSIADFDVDGVQGQFARSETIPVSGATIVRCDGVVRGKATFRNVRTIRPFGGDTYYGAGWAVWFELSAAPTDTNGIGLLTIEDCFNYWGQGVVFTRGVKHLSTCNLTMGATAATAVRSLQSLHGITNVTNDDRGVVAVLS